MGSTGPSIPFQRKTDGDGRFDLTETKGDVLTIDNVEKEGYQLSPKASRHYGPSGTSASNPAIFRMWKTRAKEPLVSGQKVFGIIPDGRMYTVDLIKGQKTEGDAAQGDLRISITRPADAAPKTAFHWSFTIEAIGGGLVESKDEFMYFAPESGYEPKYELALSPTAGAWTPLVKKQFFFRSRSGGVYGRMQAEVHAIYNTKSAFEVTYAINPNGSRNLQP